MLSKICWVTTLAVVLSLQFAATDTIAAPFRHKSTRPAIGYAGPTPGFPAPNAGSDYIFVPGRGIAGADCNLPTSTCSNDQRDAN
jgi:hypothetical protein